MKIWIATGIGLFGYGVAAQMAGERQYPWGEGLLVQKVKGLS